MIRPAVLLAMLLSPVWATAQSLEVSPGELRLSVEVDPQDSVPVVGEQVLITIRGQYRRHVTRETLVQPALESFSWAQLGPDSWREDRVDGQSVKIFTRRMALYPDTAGTLEIGSFTQKLTLTDEGDDWFEHEILSEPVQLMVEPAPVHKGWWFPVRALRISDDWSNAPDQLQPGEGVLRVIRLEALGVTPEMIPPMPELVSPSAMIFAHPERRMAELTPEGPVTYAYWRWTIRPTNGVSAIVEPITLRYFDTVNRVEREATISPQRVAFGDPVPLPGGGAPRIRQGTASLPGWPLLAVALATFALVLGLGARRAHFARNGGLARPPLLDPLAYRLRWAARFGDVRRATALAHRLVSRSGKGKKALKRMDRLVFDPKARGSDVIPLVRELLRAQRA
ncbi:hypothetical protein AB1M95_03710 [Sulfitobacter sp. LCG007]